MNGRSFLLIALLAVEVIVRNAPTADLRRKLAIVTAAVYSIPGAPLDDLNSDPDIEFVSPDRVVTGSLDYAEPTVNGPIAYKNGYDGTGVGVAVIYGEK